MAESTWDKYKLQALEYRDEFDNLGYNGIARAIFDDNNYNYTYSEVDNFRRYIKRLYNRVDNKTVVNDYTDDDNNQGYVSINKKNTENAGSRETPDEPIPPGLESYCRHYNIDINSVKSWKFVNHQGQAAYNIVGFNQEEMKVITTDWDEVRRLIQEGLSDITYNKLKTPRSGSDKVGVLKISDLHLGAFVEDVIKSRKFSTEHLISYFQETVEIVNQHNYDIVHVHMLGDLIESFTGLNHVNSWKSMQNGMYGAEAVKAITRILHEVLLSKINNLGEVKIVAGNHDRVTSNNSEDVKGEAANLISWGLELIGYDVEFNPLVITHTIGNITHILTHGHHGISKQETKGIIWDYGVQGNFNFVCEGHLHSRIQKLSATQKSKFKTIKDDSVDHKRMVLPSYFTGNYYSESNSWTTTPGFLIVEDNGRGLPNCFDYSL